MCKDSNINDKALVSIIVPLYNEEKHIADLVNSINSQDYPHEKLEVIFVDGNSDDNTVNLLYKCMEDNISFKILKNPKRLTPVSINMGIKNSKGDIIVRFDGHSEYKNNYVSKCVYYLKKTGSDNVGCLVETESEGFIPTAIAEILSSPFGVGNSKFRTNSSSGYVDTVPFGCFKRELFERIGYFNEALLRSEDNEFNSRIIRNNGKIYLFNDITTIYHPRNSINKLIKMGFMNGREIIVTGIIYPGSIGLRHLIPLLFVISLVFGCLFLFINCYSIFSILFLFELVVYLLLDIFFSVKETKNKYNILLKILLFPIFHISYGIGSIVGLISYKMKKIFKGEKL